MPKKSLEEVVFEHETRLRAVVTDSYQNDAASCYLADALKKELIFKSLQDKELPSGYGMGFHRLSTEITIDPENYLPQESIEKAVIVPEQAIALIHAKKGEVKHSVIPDVKSSCALIIGVSGANGTIVAEIHMAGDCIERWRKDVDTIVSRLDTTIVGKAEGYVIGGNIRHNNSLSLVTSAIEYLRIKGVDIKATHVLDADPDSHNGGNHMENIAVEVTGKGFEIKKIYDDHAMFLHHKSQGGKGVMLVHDDLMA